MFANFRTLPTQARFLLVTIFISATTLGIASNALPFLFQKVTGQGPADAGAEFGLLASVYYIATAICAPFVGRMSDRFGRKPVIYVALIGAAIDYLLTMFANSMGLLFVARVISGACGTIGVAAAAYVVDVVEPKNRANAFAYVAAANYVGLLGYLIGGVLTDIDPRLPFLAAAILTLCNFAYALLVLPESAIHGARAGAEGKTPARIILTPLLWLFIAGSFFWTLAFPATQTTMVLVTQIRFGWGGLDAGIFVASIALASILAQLLLSPWLIKTFGEKQTIRIMVWVQALGYFGFAVAMTPFWMYVVLLGPIALGATSSPVYRAYNSRFVKPEQQGEFQGHLSRYQNIALILGAFAGGGALTYATSHFKTMLATGAPFFFSFLAMLMTIAVVYAALARSEKGLEEP